MASIKQLRKRAMELEEEADIMEVRRILGLASDQDVAALRRAAGEAQRALEQARRTTSTPERHS